MEKITALSFLYHSDTESGSFTKLCDITSYPTIRKAPERVDISDLSSRQKKYTEGMIDPEDMTFGYNYTKTAYDSLKGKEGKVGYYQLRFGEKGEYGAWQWSGTHFTSVDGGEVASTRKGTVTCYPESEITEVTVST